MFVYLFILLHLTSKWNQHFKILGYNYCYYNFKIDKKIQKKKNIHILLIIIIQFS